MYIGISFLLLILIFQLDDIINLLKSDKWQPFEKAPKDGTVCIFWISSDNKLSDQTANFHYFLNNWCWLESDEILERTDLVRGWMLYPQPPKNNKKRKNKMSIMNLLKKCFNNSDIQQEATAYKSTKSMSIMLTPSEEFIDRQNKENEFYLPSEYEEEVNKIYPIRGTKDSAGIDIRSDINIIIKPEETKLIPSGFVWNIPNGYMGMVCSRSGLVLKKSVFVKNQPGIIDEDYKGELKVILHNSGKKNFKIKRGDRIAQMVLLKSAILPFERDKLTEKNGEWKNADISECSRIWFYRR